MFVSSRTKIVVTLGVAAVSTIAVLIGLRLGIPGSPEQRARRVLSQLATEATDNNADVETAAAKLAGIGEDAVPAILECLGNSASSDVSKECAWSALFRLGPQASAAVPFLKECLKHPDWQTKHIAAITLGKIGPPAREAIPDLLQALGTNDANLRWYAAAALGNIGVADQPVVEALRNAFNDNDPTVQTHARAALIKLGFDRKGIANLMDLLKSKDLTERNAAVLALGYLGPTASESVPVLETVLSDENPSVRENAVWSLGRIGPAAQSALPALRRLLDRHEVLNEKSVREAIEQISGSQ